MAQLPEVDLSPVQGAGVPTDAVAPTDLGLERAGGDLRSAASIGLRSMVIKERAQATEDKQTVAPALTALQGQLTDSLSKNAATYNGEPGFVDAQNQAAQGILGNFRKAAAAGFSTGQQAQFERGAQQIIDQHTAKAYDIQGVVQAAPIRQAFENAQTAQVNGAQIDAMGAILPALDKIKQSYTDGDPIAFRDQGLAAFDAGAAEARAKLPANLQPAFDERIASLRLEQGAQLTDFALTHQSAGVLNQAKDQAQSAINTIISSPTAYSSVTGPGGALEKVIGTLPAGLQDDARRDWGQQAVQARISSLVNNDQAKAALDELDAGTYDKILTAEQKGRLVAEASAGDRASGPDAIAAATAGASAKDAMERDIRSIATTGHGFLTDDIVNADVAARIISPEAAGEYNFQKAKAAQIFAASGAVGAMTQSQLTAEASGPPNEMDPVADVRRKAVEAELKARQEPGQWAWSAQNQQIGGTPMGQVLQQKWQAANTAGPNQGPAMFDYVRTMIGVQHQAGMSAGQIQLLPQAQAAALAKSIVSADPKDRLAAMEGLSRLFSIIPGQVSGPDGATFNPRAMLVSHLTKAGLTPIESSAIADFGADPAGQAKLGRVVAALNDTALKEKLPGTQGRQLSTAVKNALGPFLASSSADGDAGALAEARVQRTELVARELMQTQHMGPADASLKAAQDLTGGYRYVDGWRMPETAAQGSYMLTRPGGVPPWPMPYDGAAAARIGAAQVLAGLTANNGAGLFAPSTLPGPVGDRQKLFAAQVSASGGWKTLPDNSGLTLAVPKPDGTWTTALDKYGRPITATWSQLQGVAEGRPSPFAAPPANQPTAPSGAPVRAFSKSEGGQTLAWSVEQQESGGRAGAVSPKGALGVMQIMPPTGQQYAQRLGLAWDPQRALTDPGYNRQIGQAALFDLTSRYMTGANPAAGVGLALAGYNAGEGHLTGYTDAKGYHPGWLQTIGDPRTGKISLDAWARRIPIPETREYVLQVLGRAMGRLEGGQ